MVNLNGIGRDIVKEIKAEIIRMDLVQLGDFLNSITYRIQGDDIILSSDIFYAAALEFGTLDFGAITEESSPSWPASSAKGFKKKGLSSEERRSLPRGMVAFAPFRRVLYNDKLIDSIIRKNS